MYEETEFKISAEHTAGTDANESHQDKQRNASGWLTDIASFLRNAYSSNNWIKTHLDMATKGADLKGK